MINESGAAAQMGTAAHEGLAALVETGRVDWEGVPALAKRHGVEETELRVLLAQGQKLWEQVRESFPNASTEVELGYAGPGFELTGHVDVLGASAFEIYVADHKTGRLDSDYREQLLGYCALALKNNPYAERATAGVLWIREQEFEHYTLERDQLAAWEQRLVTEVVDWDGAYRPGAHCAHCHRNHECPAANALVRRDVAAIADNDLVAQVEDEAALATMAPEQIVDLLAKADVVVKHAERVRSAIRLHVMRTGDIVASGKRLTLQHEERRSLETMSAFPVLEQRLDDAEMAQVIDISVSRAEELVKAKAGKGKGAGAVRELKAALEEAGAVRTGVVTKLVTRRST